MSRNALGTIIAVVFLVSLGVALLFSIQGLNVPTSGPLAQAPDTPVRPEATSTPVVVEPRRQTPTPLPTWLDTVPTETPDPLRSPTPTPPFEDAFYIAVPPTPVPTPDLQATTVPELDNIAFVNPRPLPLPLKDHVSFGAVAWSPDGKYYLGDFPGSESLWVGNVGYSVLDLYMGNADTGELTLWQHNAGWPAWSRDGRSVYYLALRSDGQRFYFDLYRRALDSEESGLVVQDVGVPYLPQPAAVETEDGSLLTLNREHQPALLRIADENAELLPLASLFGRNAIAGQKTFFSLAPDGHTVAVVSYGAAMPLYLADLTTAGIASDIQDVVGAFSNVAWSADSRRLAYASRNGVFIYDLPTGQVQALVTRQDLGFPKDDPRSGLGNLFWSPDERVVLFHAGTPDWQYQGTNQGNCRSSFLFAATSDGSYWKALSCYFLDSLVPGGSRAIVSDCDPETQRETKYLVDVIWK